MVFSIIDSLSFYLKSFSAQSTCQIAGWGIEIFGRALYSSDESCSFFVLILDSQPAPVLGSDFGISGLLRTPSARSMEDGTLSAVITREPLADIYNISYQATPWLETTFQYSVFSPRKSKGHRDHA